MSDQSDLKAATRWPGEYQFNPYQAIHFAQECFLRTIRKIVPEVMESLARSPLESFQAAGFNSPSENHDSIWKDLIKWDEIKDDEHLPKGSMRQPVVREFRSQLWAWSDRWNLNAEWCCKRAFETLVIWSRNEISSDCQWEPYSEGSIILAPQIRNVFRDELKWSPSPVGSNRSGPDPLPPEGFELPIWHSEIQTKDAYLANVRTRLKDEIEKDSLLSQATRAKQQEYSRLGIKAAKLYLSIADEHINKTERLAKRVRNNSRFEDHIEWTVKARILSHKFKEIGEDKQMVDARAVREAVRDMLRFIRLPLEPTLHERKGAPKKK